MNGGRLVTGSTILIAVATLGVSTPTDGRNGEASGRWQDRPEGQWSLQM
jgi:hypothetical protein